MWADRKSRILSRSLLPSSSDFALTFCSRRGVNCRLIGFFIHLDSQIFWEHLFLSVPVWGTSVRAVIELLFPHMIVWCSGKNTEGSIAAEEERAPRVNIQGSFGVHPGSAYFLDLGRPEWNQEEVLTSQEEDGSNRRPGRLVFLFTSDCSWLLLWPAGKAGSSWNLIEYIHPNLWKPLNPHIPRAFSFLKEDTYPWNSLNGHIPLVPQSAMEKKPFPLITEESEEGAVRSWAFPGIFFSRGHSEVTPLTITSPFQQQQKILMFPGNGNQV